MTMTTAATVASGSAQRYARSTARCPTRPSTKGNWSARESEGATSRSWRSCTASNTRHGTADSATQNAEKPSARSRSRSRRTSSATNATPYRTAQNTTASRFVASAAAANTEPSATRSPANRRTALTKRHASGTSAYADVPLACRRHPQKEAQPRCQRQRFDVRPQHVPRDERQPGEEAGEEHVGDAGVRASHHVEDVRLERRQPEWILAMDGRRDRHARETAVEVEKLRLQRPVRERVVLVDRLLDAARREENERRGEHEQWERRYVPAAKASPPDEESRDQRNCAEPEHDRQRRGNPGVDERRQQQHRRSDAREGGKARAERRTCQEQDSRPERQESDQCDRDAEKRARHRSTSQSRPKRHVRRGCRPSAGERP